LPNERIKVPVVPKVPDVQFPELSIDHAFNISNWNSCPPHGTIETTETFGTTGTV
jgi:hypothetical protein